MSFKDELDREMRGAHEDFQRDIARVLEIWPPPPFLKGWKRVKSGAHWAVRDVREKIARRIAPWLDEY